MTLTFSIRIHDSFAGLKPLIEELTERFEKLFHNIQTVEWDVTEEGPEKEVLCRIHSQSGFYRASAKSSDASDAAREVVTKLEKQRRRRKEQIISGRDAPEDG